jgi:hypothetical protein
MTRLAHHKRLLKTLLICILLCATVASTVTLSTAQAGPSLAQVNSPNGLVINEVFDSQNVALEYFELYNAGTQTINLATYVIYNRDGSTPLSRLADTIIAPGQFRAIGPTQLNQPTIVGTGLDRTDFLGLVNTSPSDQTIDVVNWGNAPEINWPNYDRFASNFFVVGTQPPLPPDTNKSIQRWPDGLDTDQGSDWQLIFRSPGAFSCGDPYEDDNVRANAVPQTVGTETLHRICPAGDTDHISFDANAAYTYTLQATAVGSRVDTIMRLYDLNGVFLTESNPDNTRDSTILFRPAANARFIVQILDRNNAGNSGPDFLYRFSVTQQSATTPTATTPTPIGCEDIYEPDNSRTDADVYNRLIDLNTEQVHTLCRSGGAVTDEDWVKFLASSGKVYTLYTKDLTGPTDTVITLYDAAGNRLAENDDYQPGQNLASRIDYTFSSTNVYYLRVRDKRGTSGRGYQYTLGLSSTGTLPATSTSTATATINPSSPTPTQPACTDIYEPDGVPETAKLLLIGQVQAEHSICPAADADWVRFYGVAGKVYTVQTTNLGIGLDTYMYIFDSDSATILAQNDDGGGQGVSSRIDFYPQRDDYYFAQVKNKGDLGLPDMTYDLSLAVVPGVPQPPGTATNIIAPVLTVTSAPTGPVSPTTFVQPTKPPVPSPTQGQIQPTPASIVTPTLAVSTVLPATEPPAEPTETIAVPAPEPVAPTETPAEPTAQVPGVPVTGYENPAQAQPKAPVQVANAGDIDVSSVAQPAQSTVRIAPMLFRFFFDRDSDDRLDSGEGIRGVMVYFLDEQANFAPTGSVTTTERGDGRLNLPVGPQRIYVPYFGINMGLTRFPEREIHSLWLSTVQLPDRVP